MAIPYDDQTRAAVLAALLAGQSVSSVARDYHVSRQAVMAWRDKADIRPSPVRQEKQDEIGELVTNVLTAVLATLQVQAEQFRNTAWLEKQSAEGAAVLFGVLTDKAVRILEALESGESSAAMDAPALPDPAVRELVHLAPDGRTRDGQN